MRFSPFRRRRPTSPTPADRTASVDAPVGSAAWQESRVAGEVEAFVQGRYVDWLAGDGQAIPAWAVLNRLAHSDPPDLVRLIADEDDPATVPPRRRHAWADDERFLAAHLLVAGGTPDGVRSLQQGALVPVELSLVDRWKADRMSADDVLRAGAEALDRYHAGA